jgi:hypothetical protein
MDYTCRRHISFPRMKLLMPHFRDGCLCIPQAMVHDASEAQLGRIKKRISLRPGTADTGMQLLFSGGFGLRLALASQLDPTP